LPASRQRVYRALTDSAAFDRVVQLSEAMTSGMVPASAKPSRISPRVGGAFALFGGYISGLQVELVRDQRIVQVWRAASWPAGDYSIASFLLTDESSGTRLVLDHRGFPVAEAAHLAAGWHANYWEPLAKALPQSGH
jgi:activator of HSP90 ATPase